MATAEPIPPSTSYPERVQPPSRADSIMTADMHIPGAWVGTNPSTPAPISEDIKYFGEKVKTLPETVQSYLPKDKSGSTTNAIKNKAAAIIPESVMNHATNILPASMQPTAGPTASDAAHSSLNNDQLPVVTTTNTVPHAEGLPEPTVTANTSDEGTTIMDKAAALVPAGVLSVAAACLPSSLNPTNAPTASDAAPPVPTPTGEREGLNAPLPQVPSESSAFAPHEPAQPLIGSTVSPDQDAQEALANAKNPDEYKAVAIPAVSHEPMPSAKPDALGTSEFVTETNTPVPEAKGQQGAVAAAPVAAAVEKKNTFMDKIRSKVKKGSDGNSNETESGLLDSTQPIGGKTPITPTSGSTDATDPQNDGYPMRGEKGVKGLRDIGIAGVEAYAVDHGFKDQKNTAAVEEISRPVNPPQPTDSFAHVVIPATPGPGVHEQEMFDAKQSRVPPPPSPKSKPGALATPDKKHKHERSGSTSNGETSPSSPSKSAFSGLRKLTKRRNKSTGPSHSRGVSADEGVPADFTSTPVDGSAGAAALNDSPIDHVDSNATNDTAEQRERHRLHKDHPGAKGKSNDEVVSPTSAAGTDPSDVNSSAGSAVVYSQTEVDRVGTSPLSNPYDASPARSPTKVGFKERVKGEFMVVQGSIIRDKTMKEAGERMKKGTL